MQSGLHCTPLNNFGLYFTELSLQTTTVQLLCPLFCPRQFCFLWHPWILSPVTSSNLFFAPTRHILHQIFLPKCPHMTVGKHSVLKSDPQAKLCSSFSPVHVLSLLTLLPLSYMNSGNNLFQLTNTSCITYFAQDCQWVLNLTPLKTLWWHSVFLAAATLFFFLEEKIPPTCSCNWTWVKLMINLSNFTENTQCAFS